jgi:hypothetical protein
MMTKNALVRYIWPKFKTDSFHKGNGRDNAVCGVTTQNGRIALHAKRSRAKLHRSTCQTISSPFGSSSRARLNARRGIWRCAASETGNSGLEPEQSPSGRLLDGRERRLETATSLRARGPDFGLFYICPRTNSKNWSLRYSLRTEMLPYSS